MIKAGLLNCMRESLSDLGLPAACGMVSSWPSRRPLMPAMLT